jgi:hypothetical protein
MLIDAQTAFARERRRHRRDAAIRWLRRRRAGALPTLQDALAGGPPPRRRRIGIRAVEIDSIVGTAETAKARTFDHRFRPPATSRRRWERLWIAGRRGAPIPPISVFRLGDCHFVGDGHHRVSVARALGMGAIDAEVVELGGVGACPNPAR